MEKTEIRAVIKYQFLKGLKPQQIIDDFQNTLGTSAPSKTTVYDWYNQFKSSRRNTSNAKRSCHPKEVTTEEIIQLIHDRVLDDPKLKLCEIVDIANVSEERAHNILHEHLGMVHHYAKQGKEWVELGGNQPKRPVFWNSHGILFRITGNYYAALLERLSNKLNKLKAKRSHLAKKKIIFLQDNAPFYTSTLLITS